MEVPFGVLVFVSETESAASAGRLPEVVAGKAEKRNRRENSLPAVFVERSRNGSLLTDHVFACIFSF